MTKRVFLRIATVLLSALLLCATLPGMVASAKTGEHIKNGDFENWTAGGPPAYWGFKGGVYGENLLQEQTQVHGGKNALGLKTTEGSMYVSQRLDMLVAGRDYTFSGFLLPIARSGQGGRITIDFYDQDNQSLSRSAANFEDAKMKAWTEVKYTFIAPEGTAWASFLLRIGGDTNGEIYWDDVSIQGELSDNDPLAAEKEQAAKLMSTGLEFVQNGGFEEWGGIGLPSQWAAKGGEMGKEIFMEETDVFEGRKALHFKTTTAGAWLYQTVHPLTPGNSYAFSGALKLLADNSAGSIALVFYDQDKIQLDKINQAFPDVEQGKWTEVSKVFTVPAGTVNTTLMVRIAGTAGEITWDNVSIMGEGELPEPEPETPYVEKPEFATELLQNGGFEEGKLPAVTDWSPFKQSWLNNAYASVVTDDAHSGNRALKITTTESNLPWAKQLVSGSFFEPDAVYQASYWYKGEVDTVGCKFEWYDDEGSYMGGASGHMSGYTNGEWKQFVKTFSPPSECASVMFYVRIFAPGEAIFDDVSFYMIEKAPERPVRLSTDEVFFYTDMTQGVATAKADLRNFPTLTEGRVDFSLTDENEAVLSSGSVALSDGACTWNFDPRLMTQEGKEYHLAASIYNTAGERIGGESKRLARYKRPTMMSTDGTFLKDGQPFYPVFAYHVRATEIGYMAEIGVNTVQSTAPLKEFLDEAAKHNVMVIARLYPDMKPTGHPDNYENSQRVVSELWEHPALLAWAVMDEPSLHFPNHWDIFYDSYKLIRDIDPVHPIYMVQNEPKYYEEFGKYADIVAIDPYPGTPDNVKKVGTYVLQAAQASHYNKATMCLNQTYLEGTYFPTISDARSMWYQALMVGSTANGFYAFYDAYTDENGTVDLNQTPLWDGLVTFSQAEMQESYDVFLRQKYPIFCNYRGDNAYWSAYVKDGKVNLIVVNRKNEEASLSVPLVSDGGSARISGYTAKLLYGGTGTLTGAGDTLDVTLAPNAALVYEITPNSAPDYSALYTTKYRDLISYPWAAEQIRQLEHEGIVNDATPASYAPATKITRGDFAMFLIRTLGLSADATEQFADVSADAYYAKEIAIGKALGILKGTDGVNYNPEAEISRQDLMVICARGMRLKRALDEGEASTYLSGFSDSALVADYAVADVAAMVRGNIVKGNADGTVNPRGNTTRAEAAVVMYRILDWSKNP